MLGYNAFMHGDPYRAEGGEANIPKPTRAKLPTSVVGWAGAFAIACTTLGFGLVVAGGLTEQQMQHTSWARPAMIVGCVLLLPIILVGNVLEYFGGPGAAEIPLYVLGLPMQALGYFALSWLGWKFIERLGKIRRQRYCDHNYP